MLRKIFLSLLGLIFLFQVKSSAQFQLVKNFDDGPLNSFNSIYSGILYSIGSKVIVQYDSVHAGQYTGLITLAAVDKQGNSQCIASVQKSAYYNVFYDFKTLPSGKIAFIATSHEGSTIIVSDGTFAGSREAYTSGYYIEGLELLDDGLYFTCDASPNPGLKKIDLSTLTVSGVKTFDTYYGVSDISKVSNTSLILTAPDAADGNHIKLFVSDGTSAGTVPLVTLNTGSIDIQNSVMTQVGGHVYFFYKRPGTDCCNELWVTDGTVAGTKLLKEFSIRSLSDFVREGKAIAWNNKFYFAGVPAGRNANNDESLWVSDGTVSGTVRLNDPADYKNPINFTLFKGELYFVAYSMSYNGKKLYKTDGTEIGTTNVTLNNTISSISPYSIATDGSYLYLGANNITYGAELFRYDGVNPQCDVVEGIVGTIGGYPTGLFVNGTDLYFSSHLGPLGQELYTATFTSIPTDTKRAEADLFTLYPNPATDKIAVKSSWPITALRLIGQVGNVLLETSESTLSLESYPEGVYYVNVEFENGQSSFEKFVLVK